MLQRNTAGSLWIESKHIFVGETRVATKQHLEGEALDDDRTKVYYYHGDHLGSAQVVTDWKGEVYEHIEYTPYGELWVEQANVTGKTPFRFTGKELDRETGLYYYGARYLNPQTSIWLSADPAMGEYIPGPGQGADKLPGMGGCV
jgi:RHS repeat-associated protein